MSNSDGGCGRLTEYFEDRFVCFDLEVAEFGLEATL